MRGLAFDLSARRLHLEFGLEALQHHRAVVDLFLLAATGCLGEALRGIADRLQLAYSAFKHGRFDECAHYCEEVLAIDPQYLIAMELRDDTIKSKGGGDKQLTHPRRSAEKSGADTWPFDKPPYLILNLAIGGNWGGQKGIDYVRVYQRKQPYLPRFSLSTVYAMNAMHISSVVS